jgi:hypothetical protein
MQSTATRSSAQLGANWLMGVQQADGSFQGARALDDYYKAPFAFTVTGHNLEAERVLDYIARTFLREDGDLDGAGVSWFDTFRIYPHAWITVAALMRGRFEIGHSILRVLTACHDERTGGFFGTADGLKHRRGPQELMTTSVAGLACLWAGRLDIALRTGKWVQNLYEAQPDLSRGLYFVWDSAAGLVTDFPPAEAVSYFVDAGKTTQWYFEYGIGAAFLAALAGATRDGKWLTLAQKLLRATEACREDVYRQPQSGKIAWGAAWAYQLSQDPEDRRLAEAAADGLHALQSPEGWWSALSVYEHQKADRIESNLDVTNEFVGLLGCVELALR